MSLFHVLEDQVSPFNVNGRKLETRVTPEEQADADQLCQGFYADLGVSKEAVTNEQIAGGGQESIRIFERLSVHCLQSVHMAMEPHLSSILPIFLKYGNRGPYKSPLFLPK